MFSLQEYLIISQKITFVEYPPCSLKDQKGGAGVESRGVV